MANIRDVAQLAETSIGTVSRYLNNRAGVNEKTGARIAKAIRELNYSPSVVTNSCQTIGILTYQYQNPLTDSYSRRIIENAAKAIFDLGYDMKIITDSLLERQPADTVLALQQRHVQGVILVSFKSTSKVLDQVADSGFPHVAVNLRNNNPRLNWLCANHKAGMYNAVRHLIQQGHTRIVYLGVTPDFAHEKENAEGFIEALEDHGFPFEEDMIIERGDDRTIYQCAIQAMNREPAPTAIISGLGFMIPEIMEAASFKNITIGKDMALVALGDWERAALHKPTLTYRRQPDEDIAEDAVKLLVAQIEGDPTVIQRFYDTDLVIGESSSTPLGS